MLVSAIWAQSMEVPVDVQINLYMKILNFDRNLTSRTQNNMVIGVIFQTKNKTSEEAKDQFISGIAKISGGKIKEVSVRSVEIDIASNPNLSTAIQGVNALYITPMRAVDIQQICTIAQSRKIATFTGVESYVEEGISTGIGSQGGKPKIRINLNSAKAEGVEYEATILKIADLIQ